MNRQHVLGIGVFAVIGGCSAALIMSAAGELDSSLSAIALRCASISGAFVGLWLANRLRSQQPKQIVGLGAAAGLLLHPVMWFLYVNYQSITAGHDFSTYLSQWTDILRYSAASMPQGGAVTMPLSILGSWLLARTLPSALDANPEESADQSSEVS